MLPMPTNMIHRGRPSDSALRVAELRAVHQLLDEPVVFEDPIAMRILGRQREASLRSDPSVFNDPLRRSLRASLAIRSRLAEEELAHAVARGVRQYVVLGAGLDTFAYRNPYASVGLKVFEVDHPSTQAWKKAMVQAADLIIPDSLTYVGVDFEHDSLADALRRAGMCADQPVCFSWLGVTVYLTVEAIFETLEWIASLPNGTSITFDYQADSAPVNLTDQLIGEMIARSMAARGEPWISSFNPSALEERLRELGFSSASSLDPEQLNERFLAGRKDGLRISGRYRLMCATI